MIADHQLADKLTAHVSLGNVKEDDFDDCFRYLEIRRFGED